MFTLWASIVRVVGRGSCRALLFSLTIRAFDFEALVVHSHIHIDRSGHVQRR